MFYYFSSEISYEIKVFVQTDAFIYNKRNVSIGWQGIEPWTTGLKGHCSTDWATTPYQMIIYLLLIARTETKWSPASLAGEWATAPYVKFLNKSFEFFVYFWAYFYFNLRTIFELYLFVDQIYFECSSCCSHRVRPKISWSRSSSRKITYSCHDNWM